MLEKAKVNQHSEHAVSVYSKKNDQRMKVIGHIPKVHKKSVPERLIVLKNMSVHSTQINPN